jgi:hypothetical protein
MKAIELCVNRFDTETKLAFLDLYTKVDDEINKPIESVENVPTVSVDADKEIPF